MKPLIICCCVIASVFAATKEKTPRQQALEVIDQGRLEKNVLKRKQFLLSIACAGRNPATVAILEGELQAGKAPEIRQAAAVVLGEIKSVSSIPKLREALSDEPDVAFTAAQSLWQLGDRSGREFFEQILLGEKSEYPGFMKTNIRDARLKLTNPKALALMGVKEGLGFFFGPAAMGVTVYQELQKDAGATTRTIAASMLATDKDPSSIQILEEGLSDKNWIVRAASAKALATRLSVSSLPKLAYLLDDKADGARYAAAASILYIEDSRRSKRKR